MLKAPLYHYNGRRPRPVVWDETLNNTGGWTSDGCRLTNLVNNLIVFHCDRLGYYGLLQEVSHLDIDGNRWEAFLQIFLHLVFFSVVIIYISFLQYAWSEIQILTSGDIYRKFRDDNLLDDHVCDIYYFLYIYHNA